MAKVTVDTKELVQLGKDIDRAKRVLLGQLADRGASILISEVPYQSGNLRKGVAAPVIGDLKGVKTNDEYREGGGITTVNFEAMYAELIVSATRDSRTGNTADVIGADGKKKKTVTLRPQPAYNYAEVVARGNKKATLRPTHAQAFLIPVTSVKEGEGYLVIGGKKFILRRTKKGMKANPFDVRAGKRLENEAPRIADAVLAKFV